MLFVSFYYPDSNGIVHYKKGESSFGGHAILIRGWKIIDDKFHWVVDNSWGTENWTKNGSCYLPEEYPWQDQATVYVDNYHEMKFKESLKIIDGKEYFSTGDLVQFDEDNFFYVVGRIKDMYISGGENVYPGEIEKIAVTIPDVHDAVVVAVKDERWGEVGHIFLKTEQSYDLNFIKEFFNDKLSRYKHPHHVTCLKDFPVLANGKVDRKKLFELANNSVR